MGNGAWTIARWRGIPIQFHWSVLIAAWAISGFAFRPMVWAAVLSLLVIHEMGHAVVVRWCGAHVSQIKLAGLGGSCHWSGNVSVVSRSLIAWGGIFGQSLLFAAALVIPGSLGQEFVGVWTRYNMILAVINLLPVEPLDGAEAWKLFPRLWGYNRRRKLKTKLQSLEQELAALQGREKKPVSSSTDQWLN